MDQDYLDDSIQYDFQELLNSDQGPLATKQQHINNRINNRSMKNTQFSSDAIKHREPVLNPDIVNTNKMIADLEYQPVNDVYKGSNLMSQMKRLDQQAKESRLGLNQDINNPIQNLGTTRAGGREIPEKTYGVNVLNNHFNSSDKAQDDRRFMINMRQNMEQQVSKRKVDKRPDMNPLNTYRDKHMNVRQLGQEEMLGPAIRFKDTQDDKKMVKYHPDFNKAQQSGYVQKLTQDNEKPFVNFNQLRGAQQIPGIAQELPKDFIIEMNPKVQYTDVQSKAQQMDNQRQLANRYDHQESNKIFNTCANRAFQNRLEDIQSKDFNKEQHNGIFARTANNRTYLHSTQDLENLRVIDSKNYNTQAVQKLKTMNNITTNPNKQVQSDNLNQRINAVQTGKTVLNETQNKQEFFDNRNMMTNAKKTQKSNDQQKQTEGFFQSFKNMVFGKKAQQGSNIQIVNNEYYMENKQQRTKSTKTQNNKTDVQLYANDTNREQKNGQINTKGVSQKGILYNQEHYSDLTVGNKNDKQIGIKAQHKGNHERIETMDTLHGVLEQREQTVKAQKNNYDTPLYSECEHYTDVVYNQENLTNIAQKQKTQVRTQMQNDPFTF